MEKKWQLQAWLCTVLRAMGQDTTVCLTEIGSGVGIFMGDLQRTLAGHVGRWAQLAAHAWMWGTPRWGGGSREGDWTTPFRLDHLL